MTADAEAKWRDEIESIGVRFRPYSIERNAINPGSDLVTLRELRRAYQEIPVPQGSLDDGLLIRYRFNHKSQITMR